MMASAPVTDMTGMAKQEVRGAGSMWGSDPLLPFNRNGEFGVLQHIYWKIISEINKSMCQEKWRLALLLNMLKIH